jgi:hypothetical protein
MEARNALVLAGSGMLSPVAQQLATDGWRVVLPCRRYTPLPVPNAASPQARAVWVQAHWDRPAELASRTENELTAPAELLVTWVHEAYRLPVLGAVAPLLAPEAPVVEVRTMANRGFPPGEPQPALENHPTQQVLLGSVTESDPDRPLSKPEMDEAILAAVDRALHGAAPAVDRIGTPRPVPAVRSGWAVPPPRRNYRNPVAGRTSQIVHSGR